jgi:hypothetical protein
MAPADKARAALIVTATAVATILVGAVMLREAPAASPSATAQRHTPGTSPAAAPPAPAAVLPTAMAPSPANVRPCELTHDGAGPVAAACRAGGHDAARRFMKEMVNRTKDRDERVTCDGCHTDLDDFTLVRGARDKLSDLLASLEAR